MLDTQTFALSRWWAHAALIGVQKNGEIFSKSHLRTARRDFIAGKNQIRAIKNWLSTAQLIEKDGNVSKLSRPGLCIVQNDKELRKSSTWWAFHLLTCLGGESFPYDAFFLSLDPNVRQFVSNSTIRSFIIAHGDGASESTINTNLEGVLKMFRDDGPLQGLGLVEQKKGKQAGAQITTEVYWRLGSPSVPDTAVLLGLALAKRKYFAVRPSIDFGELIDKGLDHFLTLSQDELRMKLSEIANSQVWREDLKFTDVANLTSVSFGSRFNEERMLIALLQEKGDSWM
jgi:hypothetical protein